MAHVVVRDRIAEIRGPGTLLVASDLHGNLADFRRMVARFEAEHDAALLLLGDFVHGPDVQWRTWKREFEHLGDWYPDESVQIFRELEVLLRNEPDRVTCLLGNHEHGHVGGAILAKFHPDEAAALEQGMSQDERDRLCALIRGLPLVGLSACGVVFTHAAPPDAAFSRESLRTLALEGWTDMPPWRMFDAGFLGEVLWRRGASQQVTEQFLVRASRLDGPGPCNVVVHGHEVEREGFLAENARLLTLSTSYGMRRQQKTLLRLDLESIYDTVDALRPGIELLPLWE